MPVPVLARTVPESNSRDQCGFASQVTYPPAMGLVKVSILLFLVRVLPAVHPARLPLRCFAALITITETTFTICLIFQCSPIHAYWERAMPGRKCFNQPLFYYIDASINILYDLCVLVTPTLLFRSAWTPTPLNACRSLIRSRTQTPEETEVRRHSIVLGRRVVSSTNRSPYPPEYLTCLQHPGLKRPPPTLPPQLEPVRRPYLYATTQFPTLPRGPC